MQTAATVMVEPDSIAVEDIFRDMWVMNAGAKYRFREGLAISFGGLYTTSPVKDSKRIVALSLDRIIRGGIDLDTRIHDFPYHINLNYFELWMETWVRTAVC